MIDVDRRARTGADIAPDRGAAEDGTVRVGSRIVASMLVQGRMNTTTKVLTLVAVVASSFVVGCSSGDGGGGTGSGACTGEGSATFSGTACGGDIVGNWKLVSFGGASCVVSVADTVGYAADGTYSLGGTWKYGDNDTVVTTSGTASSTASYCVQGDYLWTERGTNCGAGSSNTLTVIRKRDCGGSTTPDVGFPDVPGR